MNGLADRGAAGVGDRMGKDAACESALAGRLNFALSPADFNRLSQFVYRTVGITLPPAKRIMVETRLRNRVDVLRLPSFHAYCDYVLCPGGESEIVRMIDRLTTNKTDFFREPAHFTFLAERAIPALQALDSAGFRRPLSVWSAGCSTGEEPYSLAMILSEHALSEYARGGDARAVPGGRFRFAITATDISTRVLEKARQGIYAIAAAAPIPEALRRRYLQRSRHDGGQLVRVCPELRAMVEFRQLNLLDPEFGFGEPFDLIFCRNVMIYFDKKTQQTLVGRFVSHLRPGGYLFIGHSESLNGLDTPLRTIAPAVYGKPS